MGDEEKIEAEGLTEGTEVLKVEVEDTESLKSAIEEKNKELLELQDKYLRLYAEFENFKKVVTKEQAELLRYGHERLIVELLSVVDNLERAVNHARDYTGRGSKGREAFEGLTSGVEMTLKEMMDILGRFGVKVIKAIGEVFDPFRHHAVSQVETDGEPNMVIEELRKGYLLNDRVIRPSMVVVSRRPEGEVKSEDEVGDIETEK